jgi:transposase
MDDARQANSLLTDVAQLQALLVEREATIARLTEQRDAYYLENLQLHVHMARLLKKVYGPRADRVSDPGQLLLDFAGHLDALPVQSEEESPDVDEPPSSAPRRVRTRGRRDIGSMDHLDMIEQTYELTEEQCRCPNCQEQRQKIGTEVSYTIEYLPASFIRIKHIQCKYACRTCEQAGHNPSIELAEKTNGSPIDKGMPGPGLLAYLATAKYADYVPLNRLQNIFARQGFELDRSTMCQWMGGVAELVRPLYDQMAEHVRRSHVLATDDTVMPLQAPGKAKQARMWIYRGDESEPYNVFDFTESRARAGPAQFLKGFNQVLLADAYGGYDGIVLEGELPRAGCWAHARRKFVEAEASSPAVARSILALIKQLFKIERGTQELPADERLRVRQERSQPVLDALHALLLDQKEQLLPKHPLAQAIAYVLNQWSELTLFAGDGAVPLDNNLAEQQMKRIALLRKNALFVATPRGGQVAAILSSITSTCRRHEINPQVYLTQLLANMPDTPVSELDDWLPDRWKAKRQRLNAAPSSEQAPPARTTSA